MAHDCCSPGHSATPLVAPDVPEGTRFTCPMHPEIQQVGFGTCPICGMALEPMEISLADEGPNPELVDMTRRFKIAAALSLPVLALAMGEMIWPALSQAIPPARSAWIQLALTVPVVFWAGWPLLERGAQSIRSRNLNMFTLIALGVSVALGYSLFATLFPALVPGAGSHGDHGAAGGVYFEAAAVITTLVLLGQVLELRARSGVSQAIRSLLKLAPRTARVIRADRSEEDVEIAHIHPGDRLRVRPGEGVAVDGTVIEGSSSIDESLLTGESLPVAKGPGDVVTAGTINGTGSLVVEATKVGRDTLLAQIVRLVAEAQRTRAPIQRLADQVAAWFVPAVLGIALVTALVWFFLGPEPALSHALVNSVAVLIIACPCALGLATPMSIMVATSRAAGMGLLVRNAEALEALEKSDTIVFDKTGTLTEGKPRVQAVLALGGMPEAEVLRVAAALESASEHPLAAAVIAAAKDRGISAIPTPAGFKSITGKGVRGSVEGRETELGSERFVAELGTDVSGASAFSTEQRALGRTTVYLSAGRKLLGVISVGDPLRASTARALEELRREGLRLVMLSGDARATAEAVARQLGIDEVHAEVLPHQKGSIVRKLRSEGRRVVMTGDGVNDAPALAEAQVGIAMGSGADVAIQSAGITLLQGDLRGVARARRLSQATLRNIRQNLFLAFVYNLMGVPIAAGVLYPAFGWLLSPMIASAAMSLSSVSVIVNALRLRNAKLG